MSSQLESMKEGKGNLLAKIAPSTSKTTPQAAQYANLGQKIAYDAASAGCAALLVAPLITMIDRYVLGFSGLDMYNMLTDLFRGIIENASGRANLTTSLRTSLTALLTRPHSFLLSRPFGMILVSKGIIKTSPV